jgi:hypothetical protein
MDLYLNNDNDNNVIINIMGEPAMWVGEDGEGGYDQSTFYVWIKIA